MIGKRTTAPLSSYKRYADGSVGDAQTHPTLDEAIDRQIDRERFDNRAYIGTPYRWYVTDEMGRELTPFEIAYFIEAKAAEEARRW